MRVIMSLWFYTWEARPVPKRDRQLLEQSKLFQIFLSKTLGHHKNIPITEKHSPKPWWLGIQVLSEEEEPQGKRFFSILCSLY